MTDLIYWLALDSIPAIGAVAARRLISEFGSPANIFRTPVAELRRIEGIGGKRAQHIASFNQWDHIKREMERARKQDIDILASDDTRFPPGLRQIHNAPLVLYVKGDLQESDRYAVAIVGSRDATQYGKGVAEAISRKLGASGVTVVSGMARGIDTASHKGALSAGGRTIAVLGAGIDVAYPSTNRQLRNSIASSGAIISEFPLGTLPNRENFPRRNRIISALSLGVVVVEAALDSGSLITVGYALEQGREVFAVPGNISSKNSRGTNDLIKKGAQLVENGDEVISELRPQLKGIMQDNKKPDVPQLTNEEERLYNSLTGEPRHIDLISRELSMTSGKALSLLLNLEIKGVARQTEGTRFHLL